MKVLWFIALTLGLTEIVYATETKEKIVALRDALNSILDENERQQRSPRASACPFHACTAEILGCSRLKHINGCPTCKCQELDEEFGQEPVRPKACPKILCDSSICGPAGLAKDANGCDTCDCANDAHNKQARAPAVDKGACMLVAETGPCRGKHIRYYYNRAAHKCEKFEYGGCNGNKNNFETWDECSTTCGVKSIMPQETAVIEAPAPVPCPAHSCTAEMLGCTSGLATNANDCTLCECAGEVVEQPVPCPFHACTAEMLGCANGLASDENGCAKCQCKETTNDVGCPYHACNAEMLGCTGGLATNANGCELCQCADVEETGCPYHACTAEMMECENGLALNENGCELCQCAAPAEVGCPYHACNAEMLGCTMGLAKDSNNCDLCQCAELDEEFGQEPVRPKACPKILCDSSICGPAGLAKDANGCDTCDCANDAHNKQARAPAVDKGACMLVAETGPCRGKHIRYYYNRAAHKCEKFEYGGCNGNKNNFETWDECSTTCGVKSIMPQAKACPKILCDSSICGPAGLAKDANGCDTCDCANDAHNKQARAPAVDKGACMLVAETGPCRGKHIRYYYNRAAHKCEKFEYGGCNGNKNNFETWDECSTTCGVKSIMPQETAVIEAPAPVPCPAHSCTAEMLGCTSGLATNANDCTLCECAETTNDVGCPYHACNAEMLGCTGGLATNANGCELCQCADVEEIGCPYHACTAEMMECENGLALNENGCELCQCAAPAEVGCPYHACNAEMLGCTMGLAKDSNNCDLCQCADEDSQPSEPVELSSCERERLEAEQLEGQVQDGPFKPQCEEDGSYSPIQCYWSECWCAESTTGAEIKGTRTSLHHVDSISCSEKMPPKPLPPPKRSVPITSNEEMARRAVKEALNRMIDGQA